MRRDDELLQNFITEIKPKDDSPETLMFRLNVTDQVYQYKIIELIMIGTLSIEGGGGRREVTDSLTQICGIQDCTEYVAVTQDLTGIYVNKKVDYSDYSELHYIEYGQSLDADQDIKYSAKTKTKLILDNSGQINLFKIYEDFLIIGKKNKDSSFSINILREGILIGEINKINIPQSEDIIVRYLRNEISYISQFDNFKVDVHMIDYEEIGNEGHLGEKKKQKKTNFYLKEIFNVTFKFPEVVIIKGGTELIHINLSTEKITYMVLPASLAVLGRQNSDSLSFNALMDLTEMYGKVEFQMGYDGSFYVKFQELPYFKSELPNSKLLGMLQETTIEKTEKVSENATVLHFEDCIVVYSCSNYLDKVKLKIKCRPSEVMMVPNVGIVYYKKDTKDLKLISQPIKMKQSSKDYVLYSSNNFIKRVIMDEKDGGTVFYIADESKYLKMGVIKEANSTMEIKIIEEWYVSEDFTGKENFKVRDHLYITKTEFINMQKRGKDNAELNTTTPFRGTNLLSLPILSNGASLYQVNTPTRDGKDTQTMLMMSPDLVDSKFPITLMNYHEQQNQYFYYSEEFKEEFIVKYYSNYGSAKFEFYRLNGKFICSKDFQLFKTDSTGRYPQKYDVVFSKDGKYILNYVCYKEYDYENHDQYDSNGQYIEPDQSSPEVKARNEKAILYDKVEATIYEIVLVRAKSEQDKLQKLALKAIKNIKNDKEREEIIKQHIFSDLICELKEIRKIDGVENICDNMNRFDVTDIGTIT